MSLGRSLDPDLREAGRLLLRSTRIRAEMDAELYRNAVERRDELVDFFKEQLGWRVEFHEAGEQLRLHKRRFDVPADRGPRVERGGRPGPLASATVLVVEALVCEQLWQRPQMSLQELLQAVAQVCAAETSAGTLPAFPIVSPDGTALQEARRNRQHMLDALILLERQGIITSDTDLDQAADDQDADLVVTASRDRLMAKVSCFSPTLLGLDDLPPAEHVAALSAETLPMGTTAGADLDERDTTVEERRLRAIRRLVDDPGCDPLDDPGGSTAYLNTLTGRDRGLTVVAALDLTVTARRDWWEVTDPLAQASGIDFPNGRRSERQAALKVLAYLNERPDPRAPVSVDELVDLFTQVRARLPRWAAGYGQRLAALARHAADELIAVGLLAADSDHPDRWHPTPGVALWHVRERPAEPTGRHQPHSPGHLVPLFDDLGHPFASQVTTEPARESGTANAPTHPSR
ncbi:TIGR02678 family protein [Actinoallomurus sp. NBC_01490]|uniref:DUF2398 family protein n=1 Tax=Actinoallomurus sp. NBC_01490 TaxID=2903557 RepID=UPI002E307F6D|nr:DUF2398 family protein [Actinoallomurus sp. NBC_01490]